MEATVLEYPSQENEWMLRVRVNGSFQYKKNKDGIYLIDPIRVEIDTNLLPEQNLTGAQFSKYTHSQTGEHLNIGGWVDCIYDNTMIHLHGYHYNGFLYLG